MNSAPRGLHALIRRGLKRGMKFIRTPDGALWLYDPGNATPQDLRAARRHGDELEAVLSEEEIADCCERINLPEWWPIYLPCLPCLATSRYRLTSVGWRDGRLVSLKWHCQHNDAWFVVRRAVAEELSLALAEIDQAQ